MSRRSLFAILGALLFGECAAVVFLVRFVAGARDHERDVPDPTMPPITSIVASKRPSLCARPALPPRSLVRAVPAR